MDMQVWLVTGLLGILFALLVGAGFWLSMNAEVKPPPERAGALADRLQAELGIKGDDLGEAEFRARNRLS